MRYSRRFIGESGAGITLGLFALLFNQPLFLVGQAGIFAFILIRQFVFYQSVIGTIEALDIDYQLSHSSIPANGTLFISVIVSLDQPSPIDLDIILQPPLSAQIPTGTDRTMTIDRGNQHSQLTIQLEWPVAGRFEFEPTQIVAVDPLGLFEETFEFDPEISVTVEAPRPRSLHIGMGGELVGAAFGEHTSGRYGPGSELLEVREYVPGDELRRIDWNATARLNQPHVRDVEGETDRSLLLLIDHRESMGIGPMGETALDYARSVILSLLTDARSKNDPVGVVTVGDGGVTTRIKPTATKEGYNLIQRRIQELKATESNETERILTSDYSYINEERIRRRQQALKNDESIFANTLRPFFEISDTYIERIVDEPLFGAAYRAGRWFRETNWTVIVTDDSHPAEVRQTVDLARRNDKPVLVFLTPKVIFEAGELSDLDTAHRRYVKFEKLRRNLNNLSTVTAFEVAPGDRLDAVLSGGRPSTTISTFQT